MTLDTRPTGAVRTARVDALDGLRGWLALIVVNAHAIALFYPAIWNRGPAHFKIDSWLNFSPAALFMAGDFAVRIFFVHSGFVLAVRYFSTEDTRWPTVMLIRRPWRLGVPVAAAVVFGAIVLRIFGPSQAALAEVTGRTGPLALDPAQPSLWGVLSDAVYATVAWGSSNVPGVWWSMPVELWCSVALLVGLIAWPRCGIRTRIVAAVAYVGALVAAVGFAGRSGWALYPDSIGSAIGLYASMSLAFVFGAALAWAWVHHPERLRAPVDRFPRLALLVLAGAVAVGVFPRVLSPFALGHRALMQYGIIAASAIVVLAVIVSPRLQRMFEHPLSRKLGALSFALYLVHPIIQRTVMAQIFLDLVGSGWAYNLAVPVAYAAMMLLTFAASHGLTRTADRIAMTWGKKRLYRRIGLANASPQTRPLRSSPTGPRARLRSR